MVIPVEVIIDLLVSIGYEVETVESDGETKYRVTDLLPEPVETSEMDDYNLRGLLLTQLRHLTKLNQNEPEGGQNETA
jgi:hypothetical protein